MKLVKTANGKKTIKMSKKEWTLIGKKAGWMKKARETIPDGEILCPKCKGKEWIPSNDIEGNPNYDFCPVCDGYGTILDVDEKVHGKWDRLPDGVAKRSEHSSLNKESAGWSTKFPDMTNDDWEKLYESHEENFQRFRDKNSEERKLILEDRRQEQVDYKKTEDLRRKQRLKDKIKVPNKRRRYI